MIGAFPSEIAAHKFLRGEPGGTGEVILSTLARALLISIGLWMARIPTEKVVIGSILGASVVEVFVLLNVAESIESGKEAARGKA